MGRLVSALVWAIVGAVGIGGGLFGVLMLTGPKNDPSVLGTAMLTAVMGAAIGLVGGGIYGAWRAR